MNKFNNDSLVMLPTYQRVDKLMLPIVWFLFLISLALSTWHDTWLWAMMIGLPCALIPSALIFYKCGAFLTRSMVGCSFMIFSGLHIHQSGGMGEFHFGIFVLLALLVCYHDWRIIPISSMLIAFHHLSFNYFQEMGYGPLCFTQTGWEIVLLHISYVLIETILLCYLSKEMRKGIIQGNELSSMVHKMTADENHINLAFHHEPYDSSLGNAMQGAIDKIEHTLSGIKKEIDLMTMATHQMRQENEVVLQQTTHQVQKLQKTVHSVEVLSQTVKVNNSLVLNAHCVIQDAVIQAKKGEKAVDQVFLTMQEIRSGSQRIADIIGLIDSIAFQTNILALNAATEASNAGQHGAGFAVVATEIRNLATKSASASKEIRDLIGNCVQKISDGHELVKEAGVTITHIISSVHLIKTVMDGINKQSNCQNNELEEARTLLHEIDQLSLVTEQLVQKVAKLSCDIDENGQYLKQEVALFKLMPSTFHHFNMLPFIIP